MFFYSLLTLLSFNTLFLFVLAQTRVISLNDDSSAITYSPADAWSEGRTCSSCPTPSTSLAFQGSWHTSFMQNQNSVPLTITIPFNGVQISVSCLVLTTAMFSSGLTNDIQFWLDDAPYTAPNGKYTNMPDSLDPFQAVQVFQSELLSEGLHTLKIQNGYVGGPPAALFLDKITYSSTKQSAFVPDQSVSSLLAGEFPISTSSTNPSATSTNSPGVNQESPETSSETSSQTRTSSQLTSTIEGSHGSGKGTSLERASSSNLPSSSPTVPVISSAPQAETRSTESSATSLSAVAGTRETSGIDSPSPSTSSDSPTNTRIVSQGTNSKHNRLLPLIITLPLLASLVLLGALVACFRKRGTNFLWRRFKLGDDSEKARSGIRDSTGSHAPLRNNQPSGALHNSDEDNESWDFRGGPTPLGMRPGDVTNIHDGGSEQMRSWSPHLSHVMEEEQTNSRQATVLRIPTPESPPPHYPDFPPINELDVERQTRVVPADEYTYGTGVSFEFVRQSNSSYPSKF